jgi:hypothetical protein
MFARSQEPQLETNGCPTFAPAYSGFPVELSGFGAFMRLAAHAGVGGAPCRKSGYVGLKRWAKLLQSFYSIGSAAIQSLIGVLRGQDPY